MSEQEPPKRKVAPKLDNTGWREVVGFSGNRGIIVQSPSDTPKSPETGVPLHKRLGADWAAKRTQGGLSTYSTQGDEAFFNGKPKPK